VCDAVGLLVRRGVVCRIFWNEVTVLGVFGRQGRRLVMGGCGRACGRYGDVPGAICAVCDAVGC